MIKFLRINQSTPYKRLKEEYDLALNLGQKNIEAVCISSYSTSENEVNSRLVNLKIIDNDKFIFFSNYESPKSRDFLQHSQISALLFWNKTNVQIRMKAFIKKTPKSFNQEYFFDRSKKKNALAISSEQSKTIDSFDEVREKYKKSLDQSDLSKCPDHWGGFQFIPHYFEFWKGNEFRLNKRSVFEKDNSNWKHYLIQP